MQTSTYAAAWRALYRILSEAVWPATPTVNDQPVQVYRNSTGKMEPAESVIVRFIATPPDVLNWAALGAQDRDELFSVPVWVSTRLRNRDEVQVTDRLEALTQVVEQTLFSACQIGGFPFEFSADGQGNGGSRLVFWKVAAISPDVGDLETGGVGGVAELTIAINARLRGR